MSPVRVARESGPPVGRPGRATAPRPVRRAGDVGPMSSRVRDRPSPPAASTGSRRCVSWAFPSLLGFGDDPVESISQDPGLVVRRHRGVDLGGRRIIKNKLLLDEQRVNAPLDQMGDIRQPEGGRREARGQTCVAARTSERRTYAVLAHPGAAFGGPEPTVTVTDGVWPDIAYPLGHDLGRPAHHREHAAPTGSRSVAGLAEAYVTDAEGSEEHTSELQ